MLRRPFNLCHRGRGEPFYDKKEAAKITAQEAAPANTPPPRSSPRPRPVRRPSSFSDRVSSTSLPAPSSFSIKLPPLNGPPVGEAPVGKAPIVFLLSIKLPLRQIPHSAALLDPMPGLAVATC